MKQAIYPTANNLFVTLIKDTESKGGIFLPDNIDGVLWKGKVEAVGPGLWHDGAYAPREAEVGHVVLFDPKYVVEVTVKGIKGFILRETAVVAILDE